MRTVVCLPLIIFAILVSPAASADRQNSATVGDVVSLTVREPKQVSDANGPAPLLARELVRQAFLIAARDECGLATRDATLREELPSSSDPRLSPFEMACSVGRGKKDFDLRYALSRREGAAPQKLWEWTFQVDIFTPQMVTALAEKAEAFSRGELKDLLKQSGWGKPLPPARATSDVPSAAQDAIWEWNELAVLGGLRQLHAQIREKGESPELLAALTLGYANLGALTEYYFSPCRKAYSARAFLYAERLMRRTDGSPWALWHRAYVRTIVGLHDLALLDVKSAKKRQSKPAKATSPSAQPLPFWTRVIEAFCRGKLPQMVSDAKALSQRRLANYLNLVAVLYGAQDQDKLKAAETLVNESRDCFRAWDTMAGSQVLGVMAQATANAFGLLSQSLRARLPKIPGLPESLLNRVRDEKVSANVEDQVESRVQLAMDLKDAGSVGRDAMEPSLDVLGRMIEEIEFKQLIRRLELEGNMYGVPTDETIATYRPLAEHHPFAFYVDTFSTAKADQTKAANALFDQIDTSELTLLEGYLISWLSHFDLPRGKSWLRIRDAHADPVFRDEMIGIRQGLAGPVDDKKYNGPYMAMVWSTSSKIPVALAIQISRNWKKARIFADNVEKDYADDAIVMSALTDRYCQLKKYDDAERCAKQKIRVAPDYKTYRTLADIYWIQGDKARWKSTLEKSLELPSMGLEDATVRDSIAHYHMERKEWKEAVVYADAAAESYSEWSMVTAARCHEMLGEWDRAEVLMRNVSKRYASDSVDWLVWCHRTGQGDSEAAAEHALHYFESLGTGRYPVQLDALGTYYILKNEPESALAAFKQANQQHSDPYYAMAAAIVADGLEHATDRDELLTRLINAGKTVEPKTVAGIYARTAELMRKSVSSGSVKDFDVSEFDKVLKDAAEPNLQVEVHVAYFAGMFLKQHGDVDRYPQYLVRSAKSTAYQKYTCALSCKLLRELKIPIPPAESKAENDQNEKK